MHTATAFEVAAMPVAAAVEAIRHGLPVAEVDTLAGALSLSANELSVKLGISPRTLNERRRKSPRRLSTEITEKIVRTARIQRLARRIFTNDGAVSEWLKTPAPALDGSKPIDMLDTEVGARELESVLYGIAYGNAM